MFRSVCVASAAALAVSTAVPMVKIGTDTDYPPYATKDVNGSVSGFGPDMVAGMNSLCTDVQFEVIEVEWSGCWTGDDQVGASITDGTVDGCMTYSHGKGVRDERASWSNAILNDNKAAGLLTLLVDGVPVLSGQHDLAGATIVDVTGWAPTADALGLVTNYCTDSTYATGYTVATPPSDGNDAAMQFLREGGGHAMLIYADQAAQYDCTNKSQNEIDWNCTLWEGLGTEYAYVQTGQFDWAVNGTTLILAALNTTLPMALVDTCIASFMQTQEYYDLCVKWDLVDDCFVNTHFPQGSDTLESFDKPTDDHTGTCATGYCPCSAGSTTTTAVATDDVAGGATSLSITGAFASLLALGWLLATQ